MLGKPISPDDQRGFNRRLMATLEELGAVYAIAHNQAQTVVLGVNQLTTGCSALKRFTQKSFAEAERMIAKRLLPHLPVYEIPSTLRLYHDWQGEFLKRIKPAFPTGNSAFVALHEYSDRYRRPQRRTGRS